MDYVRSLDPPATPYNDANEDQNINPEDILKHKYTDELALAYWVYDGHSTEDLPSYSDVQSPLKDMCAPLRIYVSPPLSSSNRAVQFGALAWLFLRR